MKRYLLILVMFLLTVSSSFAQVPATAMVGIGSPYSLTASAAGVVYLDDSRQQLWVSTSAVKGAWTRLPKVVANGSAAAPFPEMAVDGNIAGDNLTVDGVDDLKTIKFVPSDYPTDTSATGTVFLASTSLKLKILTSTAASGTWTDL